MRSRREPPTFSVPALKSGGRVHAIECMSSWVGSSLSCCHRGVCPGVGAVSGYGRRVQLVVGVGGVGGLGLVVDVLVDGVCAGESGVGRSESVVAWSVVGLGRWLVLGVWRCVWSSRRARW